LDVDIWVETMNNFGKNKVPFLFMIDFEMQKPIILKLEDIPENVYYKFNNIKNYSIKKSNPKRLTFHTFPMSEQSYKSAFDRVKSEIQAGNSFLLNLTFPTKIKTNYSLLELFKVSLAKYKMYFKDEFIVFSPETFVKIVDGKIMTHPMKGTIDASIPDARNIILNDIKETAEHYTIVDLLRNDLSQVAKNVRVTHFRYIDEINTITKKLLQVSSEIEGVLPDNYMNELGTIFYKLLPAGSISGAPKRKTIDIIQENELGERGYYTGVMGIYDGENVDSAVMIRYIEQKDGQMHYRSGCGITFMSDAASEYQEMLDKVYVPFSRKY